MGAVTFREALELIESLPEEERRDLLDIVRRRLVEERRAEIAKSIQAARGEWARGEVKGAPLTTFCVNSLNEATGLEQNLSPSLYNRHTSTSPAEA